ncbi:ADP-ribosyl cyclase/cyclic ADP-ribose hydrolase [Citrus sinensis]|uniref:ADP-ribosyl cyclase/cyclic ADP-ribose hydrolase n=1 Tax=Citrus sinensis TaxID=2711 RepID=A0ACB8M930_CITSI|nr:ADP-ribosyl cyclase/cyclic ADP-ribose hydrolase [Citrus sinensis]
MASTSFQNVSHGEYDAFLSFRGEDTRKGFIGHLYNAFNNKGLYVFRDDKQLEKGGSISPNLLKAIEESRISIIVLSKNYASSTWCLDELLKIVECKNREDQIFPIFYEVEPTVVRKQTTSFGEAFAKHEEFFRDNIEKVQKWRHALKVVANISGWELKDSNESEFIEEIVNVISSKLRSELEILKELVGMESRLEKLRFLMGTGSNDVRTIGIWGMGGLGKTTLARVVYDLMSHEFDGSSFLADVREKFEKDGSEISLQKQLLSDLLKLSDYSIQNVYDGINIIGSRLQRKKVLLIIDDVADVEQLQRLVGRRDWFGPGSKILITTRDRQLLVAHEVDEEHILDLDVLNNDEALQLFSMKAFKSHQPMGEYVELSKRVLEYAGGLPLALKVLGSFLIGRSADLWRSALERLKKDPSNKIMSILQISFEGLQDSEKKIFLDVACFFKWKNRDYVTKILEGCGFSPVIGIEVLIEKSLLTVDGHNILHMHDLLQELGQLIVTRQSPEEPGKRSRLWKKEEVRQVLIENTGGEVVEGIIVNADFPENEVYLSASAKAFSQMTNLRLLKISNVQLPRGLEYLSNRLRLLDWRRYPLKSLPSNLQLDEIVEFKMCYSRIEELWKGFKPLNMLKFIKLSHSENLIKTPDFTEVPNLEEFDLEGCTRLREIHQSLLRHNKLILLNLKGCTSLTTLPGSPSSASWFLRFPINLMRWSSDPVALSLPSSLSGLCSLTKLDISYCDLGEGAIPSSIGDLCSLEELHLSGNSFVSLPASIYRLSSLLYIILEDCKMLQNLPRLPASIHLILLDGCVSLETLSNVLNLNEHQLRYLHLRCADCLKLAGNYDLALSLLKEYIKNFENMSLSDKYIKQGPRRDFYIIVPGSEIPEWFEYQNNEGSSITISTPPKTYKNSKLVGYAIFRKQFGQAMSDNLFLCYKNSERISKVEFSSLSGLELKRCGLHPIYVHEGDKFNQTIGPVWRLNEFWINILNDDLDRAEGSGSCCGDDAGSTTSSEQSFLKRSLEGYVGAAEASGSGCCNDDEEPQPKRFRQLE